jgi:cytochrome c
MMKSAFTDIVIVLPVLGGVCLCNFLGQPQSTETAILQDNEPPKVTILSPEDNSIYRLNSRIFYNIAVSDREDGESKYDEIASGEVLLEVKYVPGDGYREGVDGPPIPAPDPGLLGLAASNCLFCHAFRGNLIGPSFYEIGEEYKRTKPDMGEIANRVLNGSTGIWGDKVMPSHPELAPEEVDSMLQWIVNFAARGDVRYYHGLDGTIDLQADASSEFREGTLVITSFYRDHGTGGSLNKTGADQVILHLKE